MSLFPIQIFDVILAARKVRVLWQWGHGFESWKQPFAEMEGKTAYTRHKVVGPFPRPCAGGSYVRAPGCSLNQSGVSRLRHIKELYSTFSWDIGSILTIALIAKIAWTKTASCPSKWTESLIDDSVTWVKINITFYNEWFIATYQELKIGTIKYKSQKSLKASGRNRGKLLGTQCNSSNGICHKFPIQIFDVILAARKVRARTMR
jgi:hypothetical protein